MMSGGLFWDKANDRGAYNDGFEWTGAGGITAAMSYQAYEGLEHLYIPL